MYRKCMKKHQGILTLLDSCPCPQCEEDMQAAVLLERQFIFSFALTKARRHFLVT
jgi:hypothetical protein